MPIAEPTALGIALIEAQRKLEERQPKEKTMETKTAQQRVWDYLNNEGEPRNVKQIADATGLLRWRTA